MKSFFWVWVDHIQISTQTSCSNICVLGFLKKKSVDCFNPLSKRNSKNGYQSEHLFREKKMYISGNKITIKVSMAVFVRLHLCKHLVEIWLELVKLNTLRKIFDWIKKMIGLKHFLWCKEMFCFNETKFVWFKQNIFRPNKYLFESNKFLP